MDLARYIRFLKIYASINFGKKDISYFDMHDDNSYIYLRDEDDSCKNQINVSTESVNCNKDDVEEAKKYNIFPSKYRYYGNNREISRKDYWITLRT